MWPPAGEGHGAVSVRGSVWLLGSASLFVENVCVCVVMFSSKELVGKVCKTAVCVCVCVCVRVRVRVRVRV